MSVPPTPAGSANPAGWPEAAFALFERAMVVEYTSLTRAERPVTVPITPYVGEDGRTLDVSTGVTYPAKAERARRNSKVSLLYADPVGTGLAEPPVVLVQGFATIRDADLQANTDRYVRLALAKAPQAYKGQSKFLLRRLNWHFGRIWIEVTPTRIWWWTSKALEQEPGEWVAPPETAAQPSDPAPPGKQPAAWLVAPADWRAAARYAVARLDERDLSWIGADGFPLSIPVGAVEEDARGFRVRLGHHLPGRPEGPGCLTFHSHSPTFKSQQNRTFIGQISSESQECLFRVERVLADWSLAGNKLAMARDFLGKGLRLAPRLRAEAARRGQPVPRVRLPQSF